MLLSFEAGLQPIWEGILFYIYMFFFLWVVGRSNFCMINELERAHLCPKTDMFYKC